MTPSSIPYSIKICSTLTIFVPLVEQGADDEQNFALTHASCNRSKGASDLRVARRMAEFEKLQKQALERGERGANLGHVLAKHGGAKASIRLRKSGGRIEFTLSAAGDETIQSVPLYEDPLSDMWYFFQRISAGVHPSRRSYQPAFHWEYHPSADRGVPAAASPAARRLGVVGTGKTRHR